VGDPTGLAMLILPWSWMAEVQRWPAIGHEVGHDFYSSVDGLDDELVERMGLGRVRNGVALQYRAQGLSVEQLDGMVARWRDELVADAFGVLMLGPAYAVTTLSLFARPDDPREIVKIERDADGQLEVHPPDHVRAAVVCRLLTHMGYGAIGERLERRWRGQHGEPTRLYAPTTAGWWALEDEPIIARALQVGVTLYEDGYEALAGIPLRSMPGFDFGPREHQQALAIKDALLAGRRPQVRDARLLIAGAVLAWAERPAESVALLRAARLAVGTLPLPVARAAGERTARALGLDGDGLTADEVREGLLLDVILSPPRASQLRR
jgi:hypothetical protein